MKMNKKDEMQDYMERAANLIHLYVPPSPTQIQQAKDKGNMALRPQPQGNVRVEFQNFIQPSDLLAIDVDAKAALLSALSVATYLDKAKNIRIVVENSGYRPLAQ